MQMAFCHTVLPLVLLPFLWTPGAAADVAQGPTTSELDLTSILENGGQYTTLLRLLHTTGITEQLDRQLKNSYDGLTVFAPNDNAFTKLKKTGTLDALTGQEQTQLLLYHVLPRYYSVTTFQTAASNRNPLRTEASGPGAMYSLNVSASTTTHLVNLSTGVVDVPISSTLFARFPFAVYSVDDVLQPEQMFVGSGSHSHSHRASSSMAAGQAGKAAAAGKKKSIPKSHVAAEPSTAEQEAGDSTNAAAAAGRGRRRVWWWMTVTAFAALVVNLPIGA